MRAFKSRFTTSILTALMLAAMASVSSAYTPTAINFQGRLTDATGTAVPDGTYSVVFTIYDAPSSGISKWTETQFVTTSGGLFAVSLGVYTGGLITPITDTVFNGSARFLGVRVGTDPELTPRTLLVTAPYAFRVSTVDGSTGGAISGNINLVDASTATTGNILKGGVPFIHNFGIDNTFVGLNAGNFTMSIGLALDNTGCGAAALQNNTLGRDNTASGGNALSQNIQGSANTATGAYALSSNTSGNVNTASGDGALQNDTNGLGNAAFGAFALKGNVSGSGNTAIGYSADVSTGNLTNATAIGYSAVVNASNKIRLGNSSVTVIEGQVAYTFTSDRNQKENFQPVDGDEVLRKISGLSLTSWNYKKQDPSKFRHYGPVAQEFFSAFGHDGIGQCGDSTSINSGDETGILMVAVQALEKRMAEIAQVNAEKDQLSSKVEAVVAENVELKARLEKVEAALSKLAESTSPANKELVAK